MKERRRREEEQEDDKMKGGNIKREEVKETWKGDGNMTDGKEG